jgi:haloalkane dehalogenase
MKILRTPENAFDQITDFPYTPKYCEVDKGLQMHYIGEGEGPVVLLLHGEPSWAYLYRKMIPGLVAAGLRVIVPDLIGFGKSDKPSEQGNYTYAKHIQWTQAFLDHLQLKDINVFIQDWGGLIGLRLLTANPHNFASIVAGNTMLPTGTVTPPQAFLDWQKFATTSPKFDVATVLQRATTTNLTEAELAAYNAPFPTEEHKAGARIFPALVPTSENDPESENNKAAWGILYQWQKPFLTLFSDQDPITKGGEQVFQKLIPGTKDQDHQIVSGGHFLQEDQGELLAQLMIEFYQKNKILP